MFQQTSTFLTRIPIELREQIYQRLDVLDRFNVWSCCDSERAVIDGMKVYYNCVMLSFYPNYLELEFQEPDREHHRMSIPVDQAMLTLKKVVHSSNTRIGAFSVTFDRRVGMEQSNLQGILNQIRHTLMELGRQLRVEKFEMEVFDTQEEVLKILPHLCSDTLKSISLIGPSVSRGLFNMDKVVVLDQWKKAKYFKSAALSLNVSVEHLMHFSVVETKLPNLRAEDMKIIVQNYTQTGNLMHFEARVLPSKFHSLLAHLDQNASDDFACTLARINPQSCLYVALHIVDPHHPMLGVYKLDMSIEEAHQLGPFDKFSHIPFLRENQKKLKDVM